MASRLTRISVYGAGSWGTALALQLARNGIEVLLWGRLPEHMDNLARDHENVRYLPGIKFPKNLHCTSSLEDMVNHSQYQLIVVPSEGFRDLLSRLKPLLPAEHKLCWATKGIEVGTGKLLHQIVQEEIPDCSYAVVSGPTFALEVAKSLPTAMTVASNDNDLASVIARAFQGGNFRVYTSFDVMGVELGGAIKNVMAIAAGISDGLGFGANARAALITRGLAEIRRLGKKLGAAEETLMGLAGVGDLVLTCTDDQSRNRRLGLAIGQGKGIQEALIEIGQAVEGLKSSHSIHLLAESAGVEMPICQQVHCILYKDLSPQDAVRELLSRQLKAEF